MPADDVEMSLVDSKVMLTVKATHRVAFQSARASILASLVQLASRYSSSLCWYCMPGHYHPLQPMMEKESMQGIM
jgi:hypothetical protein